MLNRMEQEPYVVGGKSFTAAAVNTASKAGQWMKARLGRAADIRIKSTLHDLVTETDKGTEKLIRNLLLTYFPTHAVIGEESVEPGADGVRRALEEARDSEYVWIVDPIDGTTNFVHGLPFYSVSIALAFRGEVIVGVVYDPSSEEMFVGEKGKGAYMGGKRLSVSSESRLEDSLLATGFPVERSTKLPAALRQISEFAPKVRNIRAMGSAALHLAYVAAGRLSGFWEPNLNAWDLAAGMLLVTEAGGEVTGLDGKPYDLNVRDVLASNGRVHDAMLEVLNGTQG